jgi:pimeloyl-ACP methyl ester carboxylesterase
LRVPTLVLHGRWDTLVQPSGGERTAELVPGANLVIFGDMGHDLPVPLWPLIVGIIAAHAAQRT